MTSTVRISSMRFLAALALCLVACAGDPLPLTNCTAGVQTSCACPGGAAGAQRCAADGSGFGACECPDAAPGVDAAPDAVRPEDVLDVQLAPDVPVVDAARDAVTVDVVRDAAVADAPPVCEAGTPGNCCGVSCPVPARAAAATCTAGACGFTCAAGFGNCDGNAANGCETDLTTSAANCGACGAACRAAPTGEAPRCEASRCGLVCMGFFADCNGDIADGCEANTDTDRRNCGGCGRVCGTNQRCMGTGCFTL